MIVAVVTTGRQDWGILAPVCRAIAATPGLSLRLLAGGLHHRGGLGRELDGIPVDHVLPRLGDGQDDRIVAAAAAATLDAVAAGSVGADALLVAGDRTETLAAGVAATCLRLPLVHLHGGETTLGAIDEACRHALSRLAVLHGVSHPAFGDFLVERGEPPGRIVVSGAPALDGLLDGSLPSAAELSAFVGRQLGHGPLFLLTHHPATLGGDPITEIHAVLEGIALAAPVGSLVVMTAANADSGGDAINRILADRAAADPRFVVVRDLGSRRWWGLMALAACLIGNSSSGILEAPCFAVPVVNVGARQQGRLRIANDPQHQDVPAEPQAIAGAIRRVPTPMLPRRRQATSYGDGHGAARIAEALVRLARLTPAQRLDRRIPLPFLEDRHHAT
ncbi:UDP-N-acetyl glucosamine 2-epimerase [Planctomycetota bacterium]|nr:UDP-N-acetyl glucosamine 2-epimerase [Planctomycetota bacterium]